MRSQEEILDYINEIAPYLGGLSDEHTRLNLSPEMFHWKLVDLPTSELLRLRTAREWQSWYKNERQGRRNEDGDDNYFDTLEQEWSDGNIGPIVVVYLNGSIDIGDGWHRAAIAVTNGWKTVPAVVGRMSSDRLQEGSRTTNPYRNARHDINEAKEYMRELFDCDAVFTESRDEMPVEEILDWDDYGSWGQWEPGDLRGLPHEELLDELASFRGTRWADQAEKWLKEGIPAIVLAESNEGRAIADGRGRVSLAVGLGIQRLPVIVLTEAEPAVVSESRASRGSLWTIDYRAIWPDGRGLWRVAVVRAMTAEEALAKLRAHEHERLTNVTIEPGNHVPGYEQSRIIQ